MRWFIKFKEIDPPCWINYRNNMEFNLKRKATMEPAAHQPKTQAGTPSISRFRRPTKLKACSKSSAPRLESKTKKTPRIALSLPAPSLAKQPTWINDWKRFLMEQRCLVNLSFRAESTSIWLRWRYCCQCRESMKNWPIRFWPFEKDKNTTQKLVSGYCPIV